MPFNVEPPKSSKTHQELANAVAAHAAASARVEGARQALRALEATHSIWDRAGRPDFNEALRIVRAEVARLVAERDAIGDDALRSAVTDIRDMLRK